MARTTTKTAKVTAPKADNGPKKVGRPRGAGKKNPDEEPKTEKAPSLRHQQVVLALKIAHKNGIVNAEELREACRKNGCYNTPNFKQNMKKEKTVFNPVFKNKKAVAWRLTATGKKIAAQLEK